MDSARERSQSWDYWLCWAGNKQAIAQVARASVWALRDSGEVEPQCRIDVRVEGDVESYGSPTEFLNEVTPQTLRKFDGMLVSARGDAIEVSTTFARRDDFGPPWMQGGALLNVTVKQDIAEAKLPVVRDSIVAALERGRPKHSGERLSGCEPDGQSPAEALEELAADAGESHPWFARLALATPVPLGLVFFPPMRDFLDSGGSATFSPPLQKRASEMGPLEFVTQRPEQALLLFVIGTAVGVLMQYLTVQTAAAQTQPYMRLGGVSTVWRDRMGTLVGRAFIAAVTTTVGFVVARALGWTFGKE
jgi:hypothetical protein